MPEARDVDALHHPWQLPFELVDVQPHRDTASWAVVMDDGNLLAPAGPWAPAVVARVGGREHVLPCADWARDAAAAFLSRQPEDDAAWLLRLRRGTTGAAAEVLRLRGPEAVRPRRVVESGVALLMDFGKVLCHFDYSWFVWGHAAVFGHEPSPEARLEIEALRPRFEAGDLAEDAFFALCRRHLNLLDADRALFEAAWANILRLHDDMTALLRHALRQPGWTGVIVSNIDPVLVRETVQRFDLADLFRDAVLSYDAAVRPKHEDGSMWELAVARCSERLGAAPALTVATDDTPANLLTAAAVDAVDGTIAFRSPWQWQWELGALGGYVPRVRQPAAAPSPAER